MACGTAGQKKNFVDDSRGGEMLDGLLEVILLPTSTL